MSAFFYFIPGKREADLVNGSRLNSVALAEAGLGDVLRDCELWPDHAMIAEVMAKGPNGSSGVIVFPDTKTKKPGYYPGEQTWLETEDYWIGWWTDDPPTPQGLERRVMVAGFPVEDSSKNKWTCPIARSPHQKYGLLPQNYLLKKDGTVSGKLKLQFVDLWNLSGEVWDYFNFRTWLKSRENGAELNRPEDLPGDVDEENPPPGHDKNADWLVWVTQQVLAVNYRIGRAELEGMHEAGQSILDDDFVLAAMAILIDSDFLVEAKKNDRQAPDTSNSSKDENGQTTASHVQNSQLQPTSTSPNSTVTSTTSS